VQALLFRSDRPSTQLQHPHGMVTLLHESWTHLAQTPIPHCVNFLSLHNKLLLSNLQWHISLHLTVPECQHCLWLNWTLCSRSHKAAVMVLTGFCSFLELEVILQTLMMVGPGHCRTGPTFMLSSVGDCSQVLEATAAPCHLGLKGTSLHRSSCKGQQEILWLQSVRTIYTMCHHHRCEWLSRVTKQAKEWSLPSLP
jgi:hypothetical protein